MAKRRQSEIELCFDSMTDLITNLAGGLVLIVLLLLGLTREAPGDTKPKPPPPHITNPNKTDTGEKPLKPLEERARVLRLEIRSIEQNIKGLEDKLPELEQQVQELTEKAGKGQPKDAKPQP